MRQGEEITKREDKGTVGPAWEAKGRGSDRGKSEETSQRERRNREGPSHMKAPGERGAGRVQKEARRIGCKR